MIRQARIFYASALTVLHLRWLGRRERSPWLYCVPLAVFAATLNNR